MKRLRLLILTGLIIAALAAAVIPALASGPSIPLNSSFEGDKNGDNIPDKWNVKGDVLRVCDHQYDSYDNCMMVFKPSNKAAAVWQILVPDEWVVVTEEASCYWGADYSGAINLDPERAYFGYIVYFVDGTNYTIYTDWPGGTYPMQYWQSYWEFPDCTPDLPDWEMVKWGVVSYPGEGYLGVDYLQMIPPPS